MKVVHHMNATVVTIILLGNLKKYLFKLAKYDIRGTAYFDKHRI